MSSQRVHTAELVRLLNSAKQPIYVLDDELTLIFLNRAAQEWLEIGESLVGRRCAYHTSPTAEGLDAAAAGLCPPPQVLAGKNVVATVSRVAEGGGLIERRASFLPIGVEAEGLLGVLAILDTADQPPVSPGSLAVPEVAEAGAEALHAYVRRFRQEAAARYRADRLIGQGPAMRLARRQVELAVASRSSVLLVGPPGSGRQHLSAAIHYGANPPSGDALGATTNLRSVPGLSSSAGDTVGQANRGTHHSRSIGTLVPLDCSLLGPDLLEEVAAAVTRGSPSNEPGALGTLLLHRVDEVSAEMQVDLARFFVHRTPAWRLMATAAEPLTELTRRGKFRGDLAAALSTIVIELPSLMRRRDDLPLLAQLFLEDMNAAGRRQIGGFTPAALDLIDSYGWPGNLDELALAVAEAHGHATGREIDVHDLPERLHLAGQAAATPRRIEETIVLDEYLGRVERELIRRALTRAKDNKAQAARLLGMTRPKLYRRMVQLGLE